MKSKRFHRKQKKSRKRGGTFDNPKICPVCFKDTLGKCNLLNDKLQCICSNNTCVSRGRPIQFKRAENKWEWEKIIRV